MLNKDSLPSASEGSGIFLNNIKDGQSFKQLMATGKINRRRPSGRSPIRWFDRIHSILNIKLHDDLRCQEQTQLKENH